uniref:Uncharacterized protein n=1 Tax=Lepeophtheirus salmonis TaxID=72036 RepID=A0A0K2VCZ8_LEPSM
MNEFRIPSTNIIVHSNNYYDKADFIRVLFGKFIIVSSLIV